jgi:hypothetical protein
VRATTVFGSSHLSFNKKHDGGAVVGLGPVGVTRIILEIVRITAGQIIIAVAFVVVGLLLRIIAVIIIGHGSRFVAWVTEGLLPESGGMVPHQVFYALEQERPGHHACRRGGNRAEKT